MPRKLMTTTWVSSRHVVTMETSGPLLLTSSTPSPHRPVGVEEPRPDSVAWDPYDPGPEDPKADLADPGAEPAKPLCSAV